MHNDGYPFDGPGGSLAHGFYPHNNEGLSGDVHFDDDETWILTKDKQGTDFYWTALHEIGHALGLDHSNYKDAVMYPFYTGFKENLRLHEDDVQGIHYLYGKKEDPTTPPTIDPSLKCSHPSPCKTSFDAVVHSSDGNTYFFKEPYFWTLDKYNRSLGGKKIVDHWPGLHPRVQAAYTRRDGKTVFFKGRKYWVFEGKTRIEGPKYITKYGLPLTLKRLDAAFTWSGNGKTYFFKGNKYWRYNEQMKKIDPGYPKNISEGWGAVRYPMSSVMTWSDGNTYFFHGLNFSKYDFRKWHLYRPQRSSEFFFKCQECEDEDKIEVVVKEEDGNEKENDDNAKENDDNGVLKTTVFAPLIALLAIFSSLCNYL